MAALQKFLDRETDRGIHFLLTGSSQRMMQVVAASPALAGHGSNHARATFRRGSAWRQADALQDFQSLFAFLVPLRRINRSRLGAGQSAAVEEEIGQRLGHHVAPRDAERLLEELAAKAQGLPVAAGREVVPALWLKAPAKGVAAGRVVTPRQVLDVLR